MTPPEPRASARATGSRRLKPAAQLEEVRRQVKIEGRMTKIEGRLVRSPVHSIFAIQHSTFHLVVCLVLVSAACAFASDPSAGITGGADTSGHTYTWQVHNGGTSPLLQVRFPHYRAGLFFPPQGWSSDCTALVKVGAEDEPGICTSRSMAPADRIATGGLLTFAMQIAPAGAKRGPGEVTVRFADGSETRVGGVELPQRERAGDRYLPLFGLGGVFVTFVIARAVRNRSRRTRGAS